MKTLQFKLVLFSTLFTLCASAQTLTFTMDNAVINGQNEITETIVSGGNSYELRIIHNTTGAQMNDTPELNDEGMGDLTFSLLNPAPAPPGIWTVQLYENGSLFTFDLLGIDYISTGQGNHTFDIANLLASPITANYVVTAGASGTIPVSNASNANTNSFYIIEQTTNAVVETHFHNIQLSIGSCVPTTSTITETECFVYLSPAGNSYTQTGTYVETIPNAAGCDSTITINLTIPVLDATVTENNGTLTANGTGLTYQWIDCDNANAPINGETGQSFTPTVTGNYAVEVSDGTCTDLSTCYTVNVANIGEEELYLEVYPNPAKDLLILNASNEITSFQIMDLSGKAVLQGYETENINVSNLRSGHYLIQVVAGNNIITEKLIIE